jgi:hypothetical protein
MMRALLLVTLLAAASCGSDSDSASPNNNQTTGGAFDGKWIYESGGANEWYLDIQQQPAATTFTGTSRFTWFGATETQPIASGQVNGANVSFTLPSSTQGKVTFDVRTYLGTIAADGQTVSGMLQSEDGNLPIVLRRLKPALPLDAQWIVFGATPMDDECVMGQGADAVVAVRKTYAEGPTTIVNAATGKDLTTYTIKGSAGGMYEDAGAPYTAAADGTKLGILGFAGRSTFVFDTTGLSVTITTPAGEKKLDFVKPATGSLKGGQPFFAVVDGAGAISTLAPLPYEEGSPTDLKYRPVQKDFVALWPRTIRVFDQAGNVKASIPASADGAASTRRIAIAPDGSIVVIGALEKTAQIGEVAGKPVTLPVATYKGYAAKYDVSGALVWATNTTGSTGNLEPFDVAIDKDGNSYLVQFEDKFHLVKLDAKGALVWNVNAGLEANPAPTVGVIAEGPVVMANVPTKLRLDNQPWAVDSAVLLFGFDGKLTGVYNGPRTAWNIYVDRTGAIMASGAAAEPITYFENGAAKVHTSAGGKDYYYGRFKPHK